MVNWRTLRAVGVVTLAACQSPEPLPGGRANLPGHLDASHATAIDDSVRVFAATVAQGVSARGPAAWRGYFDDSPAFFMAAEGQLVFADGDAAIRGIETLTHLITHIELRWGDTVRVDPLGPGLALVAAPYHEMRVDSAGHRLDERGFFTGIAEHGDTGWRFRDAHWSVVAPQH